MITTDQWRAVIGCFSPRANKRVPPLRKIFISPGKSTRLCLRLLLAISLHLVVSGDVETNPGPNNGSSVLEQPDALNGKRHLSDTETSPKYTTESKRINNGNSPIDQTQGPEPPVLNPLITTANEPQPLYMYSPDQPAVYLNLDSGVLTQGDNNSVSARRQLSLDDQTDSNDTTPKWAEKLIQKIDDIRNRVGDIEQVIQSLNETKNKVEILERNFQSMKSQVNFELKKSNEEVVKLQGHNKRQSEEIEQLREQILHEQSRSMRSNLIFSGIGEREQPEDTETLVRGFIHDKMGVNTRHMVIERAHRMGKWREGKHRPIVVKFLNYKDKEIIRQAAPRKLKNTTFGVNEQFPKEIADRRRLLYPIMKEERRQNRKANLVVDRLFTENVTYVVRGDTVQKLNIRGTRNFNNNNQTQQAGRNTGYTQSAAAQGAHNSPQTSTHQSQHDPRRSASQQHADPLINHSSQHQPTNSPYQNNNNITGAYHEK